MVNNQQQKHVFLVMAHSDFSLLEVLIKQLDHPDNDIFLHMDKKAKTFCPKYFQSLVSYSALHIYQHFNNKWGSFNLIKTELFLFEQALLKGEYAFFHLLSGSDLIIKPMHVIHHFFAQHPNELFVDFTFQQSSIPDDKSKRFSFYHLFQQVGLKKRGIGRLNTISLKLQEKLKVDRYKNSYSYGFGSQWLSLSREAVLCLLSCKTLIYKRYRFTDCCDEIYKQTILLEQGCFLDSAKVHPNLRYIQWVEGSFHPKTLTINDYDALISSECMFARKFSFHVDENIITKLAQINNT